VIIILLGMWQADAASFLGLRQFMTPPKQNQEPKLIVVGLYRWMRHPLYTGGLIFLWLMPVMTLNSLTLTIMLSLYLVVGTLFEERRLLHEFGEAYAEYQRQVPMLIPKPPLQGASNQKNPH
jgi:protein-S-isoprenylcysteine O-methyltransferase Ste14